MSGWWWFLLFLLLMVAIIATIIYVFLMRNTPDRWTAFSWWAIGCSIYALVCGIALFVLFNMGKNKQQQNISSSSQMAKDVYVRLAQKATTDPQCKTERQECLASAIQSKKEHDSQRPNVASLERMLAQSPQNNDLVQQLTETKASVAQDISAINACDKKSSTNVCIENVIEACSLVVHTNLDAQTQAQFEDFRKNKPAPEVLNFCKNIAQ